VVAVDVEAIVGKMVKVVKEEVVKRDQEVVVEETMVIG
jgi:hypothetical protein